MFISPATIYCNSCCKYSIIFFVIMTVTIFSCLFISRLKVGDRQPNDGTFGDCAVINLTDYASISNWHDVPCASPKTNQFICKKTLATYQGTLFMSELGNYRNNMSRFCIYVSLGNYLYLYHDFRSQTDSILMNK